MNELSQSIQNHQNIQREYQLEDVESDDRGVSKLEERLHIDFRYCLYCIYNRKKMSDYFDNMLRLSKVLKHFRNQTSPQLIFEIILECIRDYMKEIRLSIVRLMRQ